MSIERTDRSYGQLPCAVLGCLTDGDDHCCYCGQELEP